MSVCLVPRNLERHNSRNLALKMTPRFCTVWEKGFVKSLKCLLKVPLAYLGNTAAAAQPNRLWNSEKTYKTFSTTCRPRLCRRRSKDFPKYFWPVLHALFTAHSLLASALMQRLSHPTETVLSNKITRNIIVLSFKDSPRKQKTCHITAAGMCIQCVCLTVCRIGWLLRHVIVQIIQVRPPAPVERPLGPSW